MDIGPSGEPLGPRLAKGIRNARIRRGLTPGQAAALVGVLPHTWRAWERGRKMPSLTSLHGIAAALRAPELGTILCGPTEAEAKLLHLAQMLERISTMAGKAARVMESSLPIE